MMISGNQARWTRRKPLPFGRARCTDRQLGAGQFTVRGCSAPDGGGRGSARGARGAPDRGGRHAPAPGAPFAGAARGPGAAGGAGGTGWGAGAAPDPPRSGSRAGIGRARVGSGDVAPVGAPGAVAVVGPAPSRSWRIAAAAVSGALETSSNTRRLGRANSFPPSDQRSDHGRVTWPPSARTWAAGLVVGLLIDKRNEARDFVSALAVDLRWGDRAPEPRAPHAGRQPGEDGSSCGCTRRAIPSHPGSWPAELPRGDVRTSPTNTTSSPGATASADGPVLPGAPHAAATAAGAGGWSSDVGRLVLRLVGPRSSVRSAATAEPPWVRWRLVSLETRMASCPRSSRRESRPRAVTASRRRPRRCGWCVPCVRRPAASTAPSSGSPINSGTGWSRCASGCARPTSTTATPPA